MRPQTISLVVGVVAAFPQGNIVQPRDSPTFNVLAERAISPDNTCGITGSGGSIEAYTCPTNLQCCSVNGWCGSTSDYCSVVKGCQEAYGSCNETATIAPVTKGVVSELGGQCGPGLGSCDASECCSASGWCGTDAGMNRTSIKEFLYS